MLALFINKRSWRKSREGQSFWCAVIWVASTRKVQICRARSPLSAERRSPEMLAKQNRLMQTSREAGFECVWNSYHEFHSLLPQIKRRCVSGLHYLKRRFSRWRWTAEDSRVRRPILGAVSIKIISVSLFSFFCRFRSSFTPNSLSLFDLS